MPCFDLTRGMLITAGAMTAVAALFAQAGEPRLTADAMAPFAFRSVGPSLTTGRISDVAVDPRNPSVWYVAASSSARTRIGGCSTEANGFTAATIAATRGSP